MSLPLPINSATAPLYAGLFAQVTDTTRPENVKIYGQCPIWVIELAANNMTEGDSREWDYRNECYKDQPYNVYRTGKALEAAIFSGDNKKLLALVKRNIDKIENNLPGEWTGVLKQERRRLEATKVQQ